MKIQTFFMLPLIFGIYGASASNTVEPPDRCVAIEHNDVEFIQTGLDLVDSHGYSRVTKLDWRRVSSIEGLLAINFGQQETKRIQINQSCESGDLVAIFIENGPEGFVCKEYVDCMMAVGEVENNFCTTEYFEWSFNNCDVQPQIMH